MCCAVLARYAQNLRGNLELRMFVYTRSSVEEYYSRNCYVIFNNKIHLI
jgi:hypothetical protein